MPITGSPRKVPLSAGDDVRSTRPLPTCTKRAFFCAVVVEGPDDAPNLSEEVSDLIQSLGDRLPSGRGLDDATPLTPSTPNLAGGKSRPRALTNSSALADLVNELVTTERNYVQRLRLLKELYADPLRSYAQSKDTAIIPAYEARVLFGNINQILPANEAFLRDLEQMMLPSGSRTVGGVGDVALHHFGKLKTFDCYKQYYHKREEAQAIFKREIAKKSSTGFAPFIERIKYSSNEPKNRVGLRELLMEPVQRIPRYTLLFRSMLKFMAENDPQRAKLMEADEIASKIATADADDHTKLAAILISLRTSIEGFPPALISSSRRFIDCIDVVDNNVEASVAGSFGSSLGTSASGSGSSPLHCTLFLFDDKLMIVKRPGGDKSGRTLAGLDDVDRLANGGIGTRGRGLANMRRGGMVCKGVLDITEVNATDVAGTDMHLFLENPLLDQSGRWSGRPFRVMTVVTPGLGYPDAERTNSEKQRFIENLWRVQARFRTRHGQSVATVGDEFEVENKGGRVTIARTFYNIYTRTPFLQEPRKTKVVLHIDSLGNADPLPFGLDSPPHVVVRAQPLPGELCRYSVLSDDASDDVEEDVVQSQCIPERIVHTINQYGLFKFHTNQMSRPATPSGPNRSRAHVFGLDAISRNLFGSSARSREASTPGSMGSHRRTKSAAISRSSTVRTDTTTTTTTVNSSSKSTQGTYSTAATSMSSFAVDDGSVNRKGSKSRKLVKRNRSQSRSRSPGSALASESEFADAGNDSMRRRARSLSVSRNDESLDYSDVDDAGDMTMLDLQGRGRMTDSDMNLTMQLALARKNSRSQHEPVMAQVMDLPIEETIYEEEPPRPATRGGSRSSRRTRSTREPQDRDGRSLRSPSPQPTYRSTTPSHMSGSESPKKNRPMGPRPVSPMIPTSPTIAAMQLDIEGALEHTIASMSPEKRPLAMLADPPDLSLDDDDYDSSRLLHEPQTPSKLPRSSRAPFSPIHSTPKHKASSSDIIPLSIKKKVPTAHESSPTPPPSATLNGSRNKRERSPEEDIVRPLPRPIFEFRSVRVPEGFNVNLVRTAETTKDDIEASLRSVKRIKLELDTSRSSAPPSSPGSDTRAISPSPSGSSLTRKSTVTRTAAAKKEVNARMEELRSMIGARNAALGLRSRGVIHHENALGRSQSHDSVAGPSMVRQIDPPSDDVRRFSETVHGLATTAEDNIANAASSHMRLENDLRTLVSAYEECSSDLIRAKVAFDNERAYFEDREAHIRELELENAAIFQEFNEQLETLFENVSLPQDEAWSALSNEVAQARLEAQQLRHESGLLQRRLLETEAREARWEALLRDHGLIS